MKQICVVGVGYVGLVTAACFADLGNRVIALDVEKRRCRERVCSRSLRSSGHRSEQ